MIPWWVMIPVGFGRAIFGMIIMAIVSANGRDEM